MNILPLLRRGYGLIVPNDENMLRAKNAMGFNPFNWPLTVEDLDSWFGIGNWDLIPPGGDEHSQPLSIDDIRAELLKLNSSK